MEFHLPDVGEGITESVLVKWHVKPGQFVTEDDSLCQIETDKALVEIPVPWSGTVVALHVEEGTLIAVGTAIADVEASSDSATTGPGPAKSDRAAPIPASRPATEATDAQLAKGDECAAPSTRRLARELGVDIGHMDGSGPGGRILEADVRAASASGSGKARHDDGLGGPPSVRVPMSRLRRVIAENMRRSVAIIPHATSSFRCDAATFAELRTTLRADLGQNISYTAMVMKCLVPALREFPYFNASIDEDAAEVVTHGQIHMGFAAHTEEGLVVPVVRNIECKTLVAVNREVEQLAEAARMRKIAVGDLRGATITLSNIGSHGGHEVGGRPIISHPQVAVIAMGRIRPEPAVRDGQVCVRPTLMFTTSYDHRLIDGAYASMFMERLIGLIERPATLLAWL